VLSEHVTVQQLLDARESLERILTLALHPQTNHRLARITKFLDEEKSFFLAVRDPLVRRYGEADKTDPTNHQIMPGMPGWLTYAEQIQTVMQEKVFFPFLKISMNDLPPLTPKEYMALSFMLEGGEEVASEEQQHLAVREAARTARRKAMAIAENPLELPAAAPTKPSKVKVVKKAVAEKPVLCPVPEE
jgi:hypothetical protein